MLYAMGGFVGASPELLVSRSGDVSGRTRWRVQPRAAPTPAPMRNSRQGSSPLTRTAGNTRSPSTWSTTRCSLCLRTWTGSPNPASGLGQRPAPGHPHGGPSQRTRGLRDRTHGGATPTPAVCGDPRDRSLKSFAISSSWTVAATPDLSAGSTPTGTARGPSEFVAPTSLEGTPGCSPASASWRTRTLTPSWPRRGSSSRRCSTPSFSRSVRRARSHGRLCTLGQSNPDSESAIAA